MRQLYKHLTRKTRHHNLPRLSGRFKNPQSYLEMDDDIELILRAGIARDEYQAELLLKKSGLPAAEYLRRLPKRRIDYRRRLRAWLRSLSGAYESDPHRDEYLLARKLYGDKLWRR